MKYVIHQKHYGYNDEYIAKDGRSVHSVRDFTSEIEAKKAWLELEKLRNEGIINLEIEPLLTYVADIEKFQYIIKVLAKHDIEVEDWVKEKLEEECVSFSSLLGHSEAFQLTSLPDEVLLDLLLTCNINQYVVSKYENTKNWVVYFNVVFNCYGEDGYLTYFSDGAGIDSAVLCESNVDTLFDSFEFETCFDIPLKTKYTKADQENAILNSYLKLADEHFVIENEIISFISEVKRSNDDAFIKKRTKDLRAVNDLLEYPFFEIRNLSAEEVLNLNKVLAENV